MSDIALTAEEQLRREIAADREAAVGEEPVDIFGNFIRDPNAVQPEPVERFAIDDLIEVPEQLPVVEYHDAQIYDPIRLAHPLTVDGLRVDEIRFQPPVFADVEKVMDGEITELELHARMAGLPVAVFRSLRWTDSEIVTFMARRLAPELRRR